MTGYLLKKQTRLVDVQVGKQTTSAETRTKMADNDLAAHPKQILARQAYLSTKLGLVTRQCANILLLGLKILCESTFIYFNNGLICETSGAYGSISGNLRQAIHSLKGISYVIGVHVPCATHSR